MAQKKSLWPELQRERERRQRADQVRERQEQQIIRQLTREQEQADRRAARADAAEQKRQEQLAHDAGAAAAAAMKVQLDSRLSELRTILSSALPAPPRLPFAMLKRTVQAPPFDPGDLGKRTSAPLWQRFAPPPPRMGSGLFGGKARYERAMEDARQVHRYALDEHLQSEDRRLGQLRAARRA